MDEQRVEEIGEEIGGEIGEEIGGEIGGESGEGDWRGEWGERGVDGMGRCGCVLWLCLVVVYSGRGGREAAGASSASRSAST